MNYKIEKIMNLSDEEFNKLKKDEKISDSLRKLLGLKNGTYGVGDSVCIVDGPSNFKDVFKCTQENGKILFFIVITPLDDRRAFCYTIYPQ